MEIAELTADLVHGLITCQLRTLTDKEMFKILDHDCRDLHLWALALYGLRRGAIRRSQKQPSGCRSPRDLHWRGTRTLLGSILG